MLPPVVVIAICNFKAALCHGFRLVSLSIFYASMLRLSIFLSTFEGEVCEDGRCFYLISSGDRRKDSGTNSLLSNFMLSVR